MRMKKFCKFLCIVFFMMNGFRATAQVLTQDSLALVALYNSTDGANWLQKTNWLTTRVGLWEGVSVIGNRVQTLSLGSNNLQGVLPNEFCDLSGLEYIYLNNNGLSGTIPSCIGNAVSINSLDLRNNQMSGVFPSIFATAMPSLADIWISNNLFTDFPDLRGVIELSNLHVDNNRLTFEDVVPNASIRNLGYLYAPQADLGQNGPDFLVDIYKPFSLAVTIGGTNNTYQWQGTFNDVVDNDHVSGAKSAVLTNSAAIIEDGGFYLCYVSNPAVPLLTIRIISSRVEVTDNRLSQTLSSPIDSVVYCGNDSIALPLASDQSIPFSYQLLNTGLITSSALYYPTVPGTSFVRIYNDGDTTYKPFEQIIYISVLTNNSIPAFSIDNDLPIYEGEELTLSVQDIPGVSYSWTTPDSQNDQTSSILRPAGYPLLEGLYKVRIYEGSCFYDSLQLKVVLSIDSNIVIYELITPNGDGDNETFYIKNIKSLPSTAITVFNVWHQVVYNRDNYQNDWDGGGLPVGTYYYLVKVEEWGKEYKGNLYIKR